MTTRIIIQNSTSGANSYLNIRPYSRLYCGYSENTNDGLGVAGQWYLFSYPSGGIVQYRNQDFTVDPTMTRFTYNGSTARWFDVLATCNIIKTSGANASRIVQFQWRLNGNPIGSVRSSLMNRDMEIIAGSGQLFLSPGDYIEPWYRNTENTDKAVLSNCSFTITEQPDSVFIIE